MDTKTRVQNPILTGFNPDPSIVFANGYYYIATSTFEYSPSVQIHKSKDLVNFEVVARPVCINMAGNPQSGGVWAPCLSFDGDRFYLVYSNLTNWAFGAYKDCANYLITATNVEGEWSNPVYLNSHGFDASLYHHESGKKYYLCVEWDYRKGNNQMFSGISLQEYDFNTNTFVGERKIIFKGTDRGLVEGPHIYKRGEYYYLFTAEGGTAVEHAETVARSKNLFGEYEVHPLKHIVTSYQTSNPLSKAGHASMCCNNKGEWFMAHLCGRKNSKGRCVLGRETAIQNIEWIDGWPYIAGGGNQPRDFFEVDNAISVVQSSERVSFSKKNLKLEYQSIREPLGTRLTRINDLEIELTGGQSISSRFGQSALLVRQRHKNIEVDVSVTDNPQSFYHMAGLLYRYNEQNQYLLYSSLDDSGSKVLAVQALDNGSFSFRSGFVKYSGNVRLRLEVIDSLAQFYYSVDGGEFVKIGEELDASILSDEYANPMGFTGAFVGVYAGDLAYRSHKARFSNFCYRVK